MSRRYVDALRQMATEATPTPTLDSVNNATETPAINRLTRGPNDCASHPATMQPPLTSQTIASGIPMSQNVIQSATRPANKFVSNAIHSGYQQPWVDVCLWPKADMAWCTATLIRNVLGENSAIKRCAVCDVLIRNDACCSFRKNPWLRFSRSQMYPSAARELDVASNERPASFNDVLGIFREMPWQFRHSSTS